MGRILDIYFPSVYAHIDIGCLPLSEIRLISTEVLKLNVYRGCVGAGILRLGECNVRGIILQATT